jgi:hypothetical protein
MLIHLDTFGGRHVSTLVRMEAICVNLSPNNCVNVGQLLDNVSDVSTLETRSYVIPHGAVVYVSGHHF